MINGDDVVIVVDDDDGDVVIVVDDDDGDVDTGLLSGWRRPANCIASILSCPPGPFCNCYRLGELARLN